MSTQKKNNRRKALAVGLAILGVAGLSLASAAQLQLNGGDQDLIQAGTTDLTANLCQDVAVVAGFTLSGANPGDLATGGSFGYAEGVDALELTGINAVDCDGKTIEVALGDASGASLGEWSDTVDSATEVVALSSFGTIDAEDIAQISVTIY